MGALAGHQRFTAGRGAGCMDARPALAALRARRNGNYRHGLYTKETQTRLRAMRDLRREVKDLTRKLRGGVRSGKPAGAR